MSNTNRVNKSYAARLRHISRTITDADFTQSTNATAEAITIGVLPANAYVVGRQITINTLFSGGSVSSMSMDLGGTDADGIVAALNVFTGGSTGDIVGTNGVRPFGSYSSQTIKATFTPGTDDLVALTAGSITIDVVYAVITE